MQATACPFPRPEAEIGSHLPSSLGSLLGLLGLYLLPDPTINSDGRMPMSVSTVGLHHDHVPSLTALHLLPVNTATKTHLCKFACRHFLFSQGYSYSSSVSCTSRHLWNFAVPTCIKELACDSSHLTLLKTISKQCGSIQFAMYLSRAKVHASITRHTTIPWYDHRGQMLEMHALNSSSEFIQAQTCMPACDHLWSCHSLQCQGRPSSQIPCLQTNFNAALSLRNRFVGEVGGCQCAIRSLEASQNSWCMKMACRCVHGSVHQARLCKHMQAHACSRQPSHPRLKVLIAVEEKGQRMLRVGVVDKARLVVVPLQWSRHQCMHAHPPLHHTSKAGGLTCSTWRRTRHHQPGHPGLAGQQCR